MTYHTVEGISFALSGSLRQEFEPRKRNDGTDHVIFNVSAEFIRPVFLGFVARIADPGFLILEIPCNEAKEIELREVDDAGTHRDVYYLDGLAKDAFLALFDEHADLLINDGLCHFGYGCHNPNDEVFVGSYKVMHLFTADWTRFSSLFDEYAIDRTEKIVTPWDTFSERTPGSRSRVDRDGFSIYDLVEKLMRENGLYHAKTIPD